MDDKQKKVIEQLINSKQYGLEAERDLLLEILSEEENQRIINSASPFRAREYTPLKTLHLFIQQVLSADSSCNNSIAGHNVERLLSEKEVLCMNTGPYTKARQRLCESMIYELVKSVNRSTQSQVRADWTIHGREVKLFDGTTLTMPDTKANAEQYPKHSNKKQDIGYPQLRLLAVLSLATGSVVDYALDATKGKGTGEVTLLRSILGCFNEGDIAIGDALFCNFFLVHDLIEKKVDVLVPGHVQRCYDFNAGTILGENDHITDWKKPRRPAWMSKEAYNKYPRKISIREFNVNGMVYMSTLKDSSMYPKQALYSLYKRRWDVELHLRSLKTTMGMDRLSCKSPDMVRKEIGVYLLAYNMIRKIMLDGCIHHNALPTQISFKGTLQLLNQVNPRTKLLSKEKKQDLYSLMLLLIVQNKVGNRPGRVEPRAVRKRTQSFPTLRSNRKTEKEKIMQKKVQSYTSNTPEKTAEISLLELNTKSLIEKKAA